MIRIRCMRVSFKRFHVIILRKLRYCNLLANDELGYTQLYTVYHSYNRAWVNKANK